MQHHRSPTQCRDPAASRDQCHADITRAPLYRLAGEEATAVVQGCRGQHEGIARFHDFRWGRDLDGHDARVWLHIGVVRYRLGDLHLESRPDPLAGRREPSGAGGDCGGHGPGAIDPKHFGRVGGPLYCASRK
ncbi:MAG: hypothetical protein H0V18_20950, partial [Pyrinomonadaceae bacterium]|nr:hypothetical protein [Pyrinomonadaceae bacterium]